MTTSEHRPLHVWLATIGEPLPGDPGNPRLLRAGLLAEVLHAHGHQVTWWASAFDHFSKRMRDTGVIDGRCGSIEVLPALGYRGHVSVRRLADHAYTATRLTAAGRTRPAPDVIVCSYPSIEFGWASARLARRFGVPLVLDIRDLWPDIFVDAFPERLQRVAHVGLAPYRHLARRTLAAARSIVATSDGFVDWGLGYAHRRRSDLDRMFPHAYDPPVLSPPDAGEAHRFWAQHALDLERQPIVAFAGTVVEQFDFATVLDAARRVGAVLPDVRFVLCGDGPALAGLRAAAASAANVVLPGRVGRRELAVLLDHAAVGLSPYRPRRDFLGTIGNKSIEYLSHGAAVFTTLSGTDIDRVLGDGRCGMRYRYGDPQDLAERLQSVLRNPDRLRAMRAEARKAGEMFRVAAVYGDYQVHIEQVAASGAPPVRAARGTS